MKEKVTLIAKSCEFSRIFGYIWNILRLHLITDEKFLPWCWVNTMLPWHYANMFQQKSLKLQCKKPAIKKAIIIRFQSGSLNFLEQHLWISSLKFLINTCEGLLFQERSRQCHATHRNMKSLYKWNNLYHIL